MRAMTPAPAKDHALSIEEANGAQLLGVAPTALVQAVRAGLPFEAFKRLWDFLGVPQRELSEVLSVSDRTLARRRKTGQLTPEESDRLVRLARLAELALVVFEEEQSARRWMTRPKARLGGESPLKRADTEAGAREVEDMLYAVEFSAAA